MHRFRELSKNRIEARKRLVDAIDQWVNGDLSKRAKSIKKESAKKKKAEYDKKKKEKKKIQTQNQNLDHHQNQSQTQKIVDEVESN